MNGKIEITVKFNELPTPLKVTPQNVTIELIDGVFTVKAVLKPKQWKKITEAHEQFPMWVAAMAGKPSKLTSNSIELVDAAIQVFEKKPKVLNELQSS